MASSPIDWAVEASSKSLGMSGELGEAIGLISLQVALTLRCVSSCLKNL